jgi:quinol monooxygenase YgiN
MHTQIVTYRLAGIGEDDHRAAVEQALPTFAAMPGLVSKVWLADPDDGIYGGVYVWDDRAAMEAYIDGEVFAALVANPALAGVHSRDFGVVEWATRVTGALAPAADQG